MQLCFELHVTIGIDTDCFVKPISYVEFHILALTVDDNLNLFNNTDRSIGRFPNYLAVLYGRLALGFFPATVRFVGAVGLIVVGLQAFGVLIIDLTTGAGYYTT